MDVLLVACLLLLGGRTGYSRSVLLLFAAGLIIVVVADSHIFAYITLHRAYPRGNASGYRLVAWLYADRRRRLDEPAGHDVHSF